MRRNLNLFNLSPRFLRYIQSIYMSMRLMNKDFVLSGRDSTQVVEDQNKQLLADALGLKHQWSVSVRVCVCVCEM